MSELVINKSNFRTHLDRAIANSKQPKIKHIYVKHQQEIIHFAFVNGKLVKSNSLKDFPGGALIGAGHGQVSEG